jgi:hypothetical protein
VSFEKKENTNAFLPCTMLLSNIFYWFFLKKKGDLLHRLKAVDEKLAEISTKTQLSEDVKASIKADIHRIAKLADLEVFKAAYDAFLVEMKEKCLAYYEYEMSYWKGRAELWSFSYRSKSKNPQLGR